jgi:hypothetical protein
VTRASLLERRAPKLPPIASAAESPLEPRTTRRRSIAPKRRDIEFVRNTTPSPNHSRVCASIRPTAGGRWLIRDDVSKSSKLQRQNGLDHAMMRHAEQDGLRAPSLVATPDHRIGNSQLSKGGRDAGNPFRVTQ